MIAIAKQYDRKIGICVQAPSEYPEFAKNSRNTAIAEIAAELDMPYNTVEQSAKCANDPLRMKTSFFTFCLNEHFDGFDQGLKVFEFAG